MAELMFLISGQQSYVGEYIDIFTVGIYIKQIYHKIGPEHYPAFQL